MLRKIGIIALILSVSACASTASEQHSAVCKQLRHSIVMNGATVNPIKAQAQRAEMGRVDQSYRDEGCN